MILHTRQSGKRFFNEMTGYYKASFKPYNVTFWVEYSQDGDIVDIHNTYCHRMEVMLP